MLLGTLGAGLLGNLLAWRRIVRPASGNKKWKGMVRAVLSIKNGIFNAASSFNKFWIRKLSSEWTEY